MILAFDHSVENKGKYDFSIPGNQFEGSNEPGVVWVMQDVNGNGKPDDEWYELRGSETGGEWTVQEYAVTYYRPAGPRQGVKWTDNLGRSGQVAYLGQFHAQDYYYPLWLEEESHTYYGTGLRQNTTQTPGGDWSNNSFEWGYVDNAGSDNLESSSKTGKGLFIVNEGMFQYGNATLSYYDPETKTVENEVFHRANAFKLGDVAQSMTLHNGVGWIAVNNSHVVFAVDPDTFREVGRITNLTSPRYIHFVSDEKAYVTQIWDNRIFIVNPKRYEITGYIECPDMTAESGSTEQMVQYGKYVFVNCWSYQNRILKIDTETDRVVGQLTVGIQPASLAMDRNNKLWTVTDGGYEGKPLRI